MITQDFLELSRTKMGGFPSTRPNYSPDQLSLKQRDITQEQRGGTSEAQRITSNSLKQWKRGL